MFATSGRDGAIRIWDVRTSGTTDGDGNLCHRPAQTILNAHRTATSNPYTLLHIYIYIYYVLLNPVSPQTRRVISLLAIRWVVAMGGCYGWLLWVVAMGGC